ncbi:hypothetical protein AYI68_g7404 [Smittium mucronatum]|uniref:Uncharacterized protein n=1 Tax=Smittium mucronatum TaxID=133383 RepID=A0A1R0GNT1_9FUNG|nr:hypothetical protein AYI68_g7404 [Smittium mucronatum]
MDTDWCAVCEKKTNGGIFCSHQCFLQNVSVAPSLGRNSRPLRDIKYSSLTDLFSHHHAVPSAAAEPELRSRRNTLPSPLFAGFGGSHSDIRHEDMVGQVVFCDPQYSQFRFRCLPFSLLKIRPLPL